MKKSSIAIGSLVMTLLLIALIVFSTSLGLVYRTKVHHYAVGAERTITLYAQGVPVRVWQGKFSVDLGDGTARFLYKGRMVIITGTFVIEDTSPELIYRSGEVD